MSINIGTSGRYQPGTVFRQEYRTLLDVRGSMRRANQHPRRRRSWDLPFTVMRSSEIATILSEWDTAKGAAGEVTFTPPGLTTSVPCRFNQDSIKIEAVGVTAYDVTYKLTEDTQI